ncbi:MAG: hypothetical protein RLT05_15685 [Bauldia litoralis]
MTTLRASPLLRRALFADALASGAMALLLVAGGGLLAGLLGMAPGFLRGVGLFLVPYAAFVGYLASRSVPPATLTWIVIIGNGLWVVASIAVLVGGILSPTALGVAFVLAQAAAVGVFAELQYMGSRRATLRTA